MLPWINKKTYFRLTNRLIFVWMKSLYLSGDEWIIVTGSTSSHQSLSGQGVEIIIVKCGRGFHPGSKRTLIDYGIIPCVVYCWEKKIKCFKLSVVWNNHCQSCNKPIHEICILTKKFEMRQFQFVIIFMSIF